MDACSLTYLWCASLLSVIGALIGKQEGRNIEVMNSFELLSHTVEEKIIIDKEYYYTKEEQCERGYKWVGKRSEVGRFGGAGVGLVLSKSALLLVLLAKINVR